MKDQKGSLSVKLLNCFKNSRVTIFSTVIIAFSVLFWVVHILTKGVYIRSYMFGDVWDSFNDFFNPLIASGTDNPWNSPARNYPAMPFFILSFFYRLLPQELWVADKTIVRGQQSGVMALMCFLMICLVITVLSVYRISEKADVKEQRIFVFALICSGPMLFLVERGNVLFLSLALSFVFMATYKSENLLVRIFGYICLAIAAAIKVYPAIFGLFLVNRKKIKEAVLLAIFGVIGFTAPFFAYGGLDALRKMVSGMKYNAGIQNSVTSGFGHNFSIKNIIAFVGKLFGHDLYEIPIAVTVLVAAACVVLFILAKEEWMKAFALTMACIWLPSFSYTYTLTLLFIPITLFYFGVDTKCNSKFSLVYQGCFVLLMLPLITPLAAILEHTSLPISYACIAVNVAIIITFIICYVDAIKSRIVTLKAEK